MSNSPVKFQRPVGIISFSAEFLDRLCDLPGCRIYQVGRSGVVCDRKWPQLPKEVPVPESHAPSLPAPVRVTEERQHPGHQVQTGEWRSALWTLWWRAKNQTIFFLCCRLKRVTCRWEVWQGHMTSSWLHPSLRHQVQSLLTEHLLVSSGQRHTRRVFTFSQIHKAVKMWIWSRRVCLRHQRLIRLHSSGHVQTFLLSWK